MSPVKFIHQRSHLKYREHPNPGIRKLTMHRVQRPVSPQRLNVLSAVFMIFFVVYLVRPGVARRTWLLLVRFHSVE